jgi:oligopeptidase A
MDNPLLSRVFPIPFDRVRAEHVRPAVDRLLGEAQQAIEAIAGDTGPRTFDNTLGALERATEHVEHAMRVVAHLEHCATTPELREAYNEAQPRVSELVSRIPLNEGLWRAFQRYAETEEARGLRGAKARLLKKTTAEFRRHGAELDHAGKERLASIDVELTKLTLKFAQNALDATNAFELVIEDEARLAGLPESARQAARESAESKGKKGWRFTLQAPSWIPVLTYLDDASIRGHIYRAHVSRATSGDWDNRPLLQRVIALRAEKAKLVGYPSFADLVLEDRMAENGARARAFVDDLVSRTAAFFARETAELQAFRNQLEGPEARPLEAWDVAYYAEKLRQERYRFDEEQLKPYFGFQRVLAGAFEIARRIYGVRIEPWSEAPVWHETVTAYKVIDESDNRWLAGIYVDPYPRETKHGGAWMDGVLARGASEEDQRHIGVLAANVTPPMAGKDAELTHQEVETIFHELGHLMHHCLSRAELRSQAGTKVAWDFVELPSQILENWCWEREALDLFARHADTGEAIPPELLDAMRRARTFRAATMQMRQLGLASADLLLHSEYDPDRDGDAVSFGRAVMERFSPTRLPPEHATLASFDHLFADPVGYAAGYYSYKWAEVLDADAFSRFRRDGLLTQDVGLAFRREVLERGDEENPAELFRRYMGRDPELEPLLERLGLLSLDSN